MWTCKKCEGTNIVTVTEINKKGEKKPLSFVMTVEMKVTGLKI